MTDIDERRTWNRRRFLQAAGVTTAMLAGCSGLTDREYIADTVVLPDPAQAELGFPAVVERTERRSIDGSAGGQEFSVTIQSSISVYAETDIEFETQVETPTGTPGTGSLEDLDEETLGGGTVSVGALSTPAARVAGDSVNPLARTSLGELLTTDAAESFLSSTGVGDGESVDWARGPVLLSPADGDQTPSPESGSLPAAEGSLLDRNVAFETHAGIVSSETPNVTYLHMARVENDDSVVITAGVQSVEVEDTTRAFVGEDGYLTQAELTEVRATVADVNERLVVR